MITPRCSSYAQRMDDLAPILRSKGMDGTARGGVSSTGALTVGGVRGMSLLLLIKSIFIFDICEFWF